MPHLAPLPWIHLPLLIMMMLYLHSTLLHHHQPSSFMNHPNTKTYLPYWKWSYDTPTP